MGTVKSSFKSIPSFSQKGKENGVPEDAERPGGTMANVRLHLLSRPGPLMFCLLVPIGKGESEIRSFGKK